MDFNKRERALTQSTLKSLELLFIKVGTESKGGCENRNYRVSSEPAEALLNRQVTMRKSIESIWQVK